MKRVYLTKITQHNQECYIGKADPRVLVQMAKTIGVGDIQDAQRPLSAKRVTDIAKYVEDASGILPNTLTIATNDSSLKVHPHDSIPDLYFIEFPDSTAEYEIYKDKLDVMDGQHRLYSFLDQYRKISDSDMFEIGFTLYVTPTLKTRRSIFVSCNEKQEKVSGNLLLWFKDQLDLITGTDKRLYAIATSLANEHPLKGHIIKSAEKCTNGIKLKEVTAELKKIGILDFHVKENKLTDDQIIQLLTTYFSAWETVCEFDFSTSKASEAGVAVKTAGLRLMIEILPAVWNHAISTKSKANTTFIESTLKKMIDKHGVLYNQFFLDEDLNKYFRDRTMTQELAKKCSDMINTIDAEDFNPLG